MATFADSAIVPYDILRALGVQRYQTTLLCYSCHTRIPAHDGPAWVTDGLCLDCYADFRRQRQGATHPMSAWLMPDRAINDPLFCLPTRLLLYIEQQTRAGGWTAPLTAAALAGRFGLSPAAIRKRLAQLRSRGYIERRAVSSPHGGRVNQYRVNIERATGAAGPPVQTD